MTLLKIALVSTIKGGPNSGWHAPPRGTHTGDKHRAVGSGKASKPTGSVLNHRYIENHSYVSDGGALRSILKYPDVHDKIKAYLQEQPQAVLDAMASKGVDIIVAKTDDDFVKEYQRMLKGEKREVAPADVNAFFNTSYMAGQVVMRPSMAQDIFNHEIGHVVSKHSTGQRDWLHAWISDATLGRHTKYSFTAEEAFAESYMAYIASGGVASSPKYAATFAAVEEVVNGID